MLYIHIPFCSSKCPYCAFNSFATSFDGKKYIDAVIKQIFHDIKKFNFKEFSSIYIGGGTPSVLDADLYIYLLKTIDNFIRSDAEITIEANPNSVSFEWLEKVKKAGVNRVSFGVQSFDKSKLKLLGRKHSRSDGVAAIKNAKDAGFAEINIDLIYGVKGDTKELLSSDLREAKECGATHISAYTLIIEENTPFEKRPELSSENIDLIRWFAGEIESAGYPRYEVAAYGKKRSIHNMGYWAKKDYLGAGAGAVGTVGKVRYEPYKDPDRYISDPIYKDIENLTDSDIKIEKIMLGIRSKVGVPLDLIDKYKLDLLLKEKKIYIEDGYAKATDLFLADEIALFI